MTCELKSNNIPEKDSDETIEVRQYCLSDEYYSDVYSQEQGKIAENKFPEEPQKKPEQKEMDKLLGKEKSNRVVSLLHSNAIRLAAPTEYSFNCVERIPPQKSNELKLDAPETSKDCFKALEKFILQAKQTPIQECGSHLFKGKYDLSTTTLVDLYNKLCRQLIWDGPIPFTAKTETILADNLRHFWANIRYANVDSKEKKPIAELVLAMIDNPLPLAHAFHFKNLDILMGIVDTSFNSCGLGLESAYLNESAGRITNHYFNNYKMRPYESLEELFEERIYSAGLSLCLSAFRELNPAPRINVFKAYQTLMHRSAINYQKSMGRLKLIQKKYLENNNISDDLKSPIITILEHEASVIPVITTFGLAGSLQYRLFKKEIDVFGKIVNRPINRKMLCSYGGGKDFMEYLDFWYLRLE